MRRLDHRSDAALAGAAAGGRDPPLGAIAGPVRTARVVVSASDHWDARWRSFAPTVIPQDAFETEAGIAVHGVFLWPDAFRSFLTRLGPVHGRDVLDLGCGNGMLTLYLAQRGARVTAVDASAEAVANTAALAAVNGVSRSVQAIQVDALDLRELGRSFDLVAGVFILHHLEPFGAAVDVLHRVVAPRGRFVFYENSGRNPVLRLLRRHATGRFGVPKFGDRLEEPLRPEELDLLRARFADVEVHHPNFVFLQMAKPYLFRNNERIGRYLGAFDSVIYRSLPAVRPFGYHLIVQGRKVGQPLT